MAKAKKPTPIKAAAKKKPAAKAPEPTTEAVIPVVHFRGKHGAFAVCGVLPTGDDKTTDLEAGVSGCDGCLRFIQAAG